MKPHPAPSWLPLCAASDRRSHYMLALCLEEEGVQKSWETKPFQDPTLLTDLLSEYEEIFLNLREPETVRE